MAALEQQQRYGLSTSPSTSTSTSTQGRVSVLHVKLTESALRSVEENRSGGGPCGQPSIRFSGNQGKIYVPRRGRPGEVQTFAFYLSSVTKDNPQGSFECIKQYVTCEGSVQLESVGGIQHKITVCTTGVSYQKARQSMTLAEEETHSRGAIVIKPDRRYLGKQVRIWKPAPDLSHVAPCRQASRPVVMSGTVKRTAGSGSRPLRERLTHLLALKPYRKPDLVLRLQKDGLTAQDRHVLDELLQEVAALHRDNTFTLKDALFGKVRKDWPGYTEGDQQLLQRVLLRKSAQSQNAPPVSCERSPEPLMDPTDSPPSQKRPKEFQDPLANKKPRISHLAGKKAGSVNGKLGVSSRREGGEVRTEDKVTVSRLPLPGVTRSFDPLSDVSNDSAHKRKDREDLDAVKAEKLCPPPPGRGSALFLLQSDQKGACQSSTEPSGTAPKPSYLQKYTTVRSQAQRQEYKNDFNVEYSEYRRLHTHIEGVTRRFTELDSELRQLQPGTAAYETIHNRILQEYRKIKKANPTYNQEKSRCEFLHRKLAHIKKLIAEFDQRQLHGWT